jgi:ABC-type Na+ transport system ATPase subunit NatA
MLVSSKANFNILLGREWIHGISVVPSSMHQRVAIWRGDGIVENIGTDKIYFFAEVNDVTRKTFEKNLAILCHVFILKMVVLTRQM